MQTYCTVLATFLEQPFEEGNISRARLRAARTQLASRHTCLTQGRAAAGPTKHLGQRANLASTL